MDPMTNRMASVLCACSIAAISAAVFADEVPKTPPQQTEREKAAPADGDLLSGPKVPQDATRTPARPMKNKGDARRAEQLPPRAWFRAVTMLELTPQQQAEFKAIADEYEQAVKAFREKHDEELRALQQKMREARAAGTPPRELRQELQKINSQMPKAMEYQKRIWEQLDAAQQEALQSKLNDVRKELARRQADPQKRRPATDGTMQRGEDGDSKNVRPRQPRQRDRERSRPENKPRQRPSTDAPQTEEAPAAPPQN
jgi:hypothetical protein